MNNVINHKGFTSVFLVGVGGISMSGIAQFCLNLGIKVGGSDANVSAQTEILRSMGVKVFDKHNGSNVYGYDVVVYSSAISMDNVELNEARKNNIPVYKRSEFLQMLLETYSKRIAISGSHGKTTCTAMLSKILILAGLDPTVFLGGEDLEYGNFRMGYSDYAVVEACEYKKSFLDFKPKIAVVLNVDNDHLDCYSGMDEMANCFKQFVGDNLAVINADEKYASFLENCTTITFGINNMATYTANKIRRDDSGYSFNITAYSINCGRIKLKVKGKHNIYNALCAFATADLLGVPREVSKKALSSFLGVKRRNEYLGNAFGLEWYADYAHHPKEICATINTFLERGNDFITVFQPHTYSRTKILMNDFVNALSKSTPLVIYKTYPAREKYNAKGSAKRLYENIIQREKQNVDKVVYVQTVKQLLTAVNGASNGIKKVLVLGAGDIYQLVCKLVQKK